VIHVSEIRFDEIALKHALVDLALREVLSGLGFAILYTNRYYAQLLDAAMM